MKKLFLFLLAATMFVACDKGSGPVKKISLPQSIDIIGGQSQRLTLTVEPAGAAYTAMWESSDSEIVSVNEKGEIWAADTIGTATVTVIVTNEENVEFTAKCEVNVIDYLESIEFDKVALFDLDTVNTFKGIVLRPDSFRPDSSIVYKEVLMDLMPATFGLVSNTMYFDALGHIAGADGMNIMLNTVFGFDEQYMYCLGNYFIVPVDSLKDKNGNIKSHHASEGIFDQELYTMFWTQVLTSKPDEEMPNPDDFPYFTPESSVLINTFAAEEGLDMVEGGYVVNGVFELDHHPTDQSLFAIPYYNINVKAFTNRIQGGLATAIFTDPETGEEFEGFVDANEDEIVDMAPIVDFNFIKGEPTVAAAAPRAIKAKTVKKMYSISKLTHLVERMRHSNLTFNR